MNRARSDVIRGDHPVIPNLSLQAKVPLMNVSRLHVQLEVDVENTLREHDIRGQHGRERIASGITPPRIVQASGEDRSKSLDCSTARHCRPNETSAACRRTFRMPREPSSSRCLVHPTPVQAAAQISPGVVVELEAGDSGSPVYCSPAGAFLKTVLRMPWSNQLSFKVHRPAQRVRRRVRLPSQPGTHREARVAFQVS